tara:strand:- start:143 stop:337 length:195 start_codon:yes stop_codon:yes gene_type:complete
LLEAAEDQEILEEMLQEVLVELGAQQRMEEPVHQRAEMEQLIEVVAQVQLGDRQLLLIVKEGVA